MASRKKPATTTKTKVRKGDAKKTASRAARRNTDSGPSRLENDDDVMVRQGQDVQATAAAFPHNPTKPSEYGRDNALDPPEGAHVEISPLVGASTLSEAQVSRRRPARARRPVRWIACAWTAAGSG